MVNIYRCKRCEHEWAGRLSRQPKVCPRCNSPYWNKARRKETDSDILKESLVGDSDSETYNYLKSDWSGWRDTAKKLIRVAYKIESERSSADKRFISFGNDDVYYMLVGFALENYLKGAIVQNLLIGGKPLKKDKLDKVLKSHNIAKLVSEAGLEVKRGIYRSYFDYLTECIEWRGRYPLPVEASEISGSIVYHPPKEDDTYYIAITGSTLAIPIDDIHEMVEMVERHSERIKEKMKGK